MFVPSQKCRSWAAYIMGTGIVVFSFAAFVLVAPAMAHEVDQRLGGFSSADGESRSMVRFGGKADAPAFADGEISPSISISGQVERVRIDESNLPDNKYMKENFPEGERLDRNFGADGSLVVSKRTELTIGGSVAGDGVTKTAMKRLSMGHWLLGDQLRVGFSASTSDTRRPQDSFLDYDSATIVLRPQVLTNVGSLSLKAILNPTTTLSSDYTIAQSTERPLLHAWSVGIKQFISRWDGAVHIDAARVINLGDLDTNMSTGELTGTQFGFSYLQALWKDAQGKLSYRYAREDEFTRAYGDHLVFGSDSYVAAVSQEFQKVRIAGEERPLLVDLAATRYLHNKASSATTIEMGASTKF